MPFQFVHIPKTGGSSLAEVFGMGHDHEPASRMDPRVFTFAFVRNPYARLWSAWQFVQTAHENPPRSGFEEFALHGGTEECAPFFKPMAWFLDRPVSFIGRFETLQADADRLADILGLERKPLPVINRSDGPHWCDVYTAEMKAAVYRRYELDFTRFAYGG